MGHSVRQVSTMTRLAAILAFLLLADTALLPGQSLSIGVKGGVRASDDFQDAATSESRRYVVGPTATLALPLGFAIEFSRNNHEMPSPDAFGDQHPSRSAQRASIEGAEGN